MARYRIRHLPVIEDDALTGIVSMRDLVNAIIAGQEFVIDQLQTYIAVTYPA
jgi:CBS domain-containing protein